MPKLHRVATLDKLPEGEKLAVKIGALEMALFHHRGVIHAVEDACPHQGVPLSDAGTCRGDKLICVLHGASFELASGATSGPPAPHGLQVYKTVLEGEEIFIELP